MIAAHIDDLQERLEAAADPKTRDWFERYLKRAIAYRGLKTPLVAKIVAEWRSAHNLQKLSEDAQLDLCGRLMRQRHAEDKFAGTVYMQKYLLRRMEPDPILTLAEQLFAEGAIFDWSTNDWICVRVLGPLLARHGMEAAARIAGWHNAPNLWQRRSAIVPFRAVVREERYHPLIGATIATLVRERERFIQTGIGWVISDLSKCHPDEAAALVERHFDALSPEVIRRHTRYLADHGRYRSRKREGGP